jgi:hypothetical protein
VLLALSGGHARWLEVIDEVEKGAGETDRPPPASAKSFAPHTFLWARSPVYELGVPRTIEAIVATTEPVKAVLRHRELGDGEFASVPMQQGYGMSFRADLPATALTGGVVEYFVEVSTPDGEPIPGLRYPRSTPSVWIVPYES